MPETPGPSHSPIHPILTPVLKHWALARLVILALVIVAIYQGLSTTGLLDQDSPEGIRQLVQQWGAYSVLGYIAAFCLGQVLHMPGILFVATGPLIFGPLPGFVYAMVGATLSVCLSFFLVRSIGGTPLSKPDRRWTKGLMRSLETRPLHSILLLRVTFATAPWLNYGLAMSSVSFRHYFLGSVIGFTPQIVLAVFFSEWLFSLVN